MPDVYMIFARVLVKFKTIAVITIWSGWIMGPLEFVTGFMPGEDHLWTYIGSGAMFESLTLGLILKLLGRNE